MSKWRIDYCERCARQRMYKDRACETCGYERPRDGVGVLNDWLRPMRRFVHDGRLHVEGRPTVVLIDESGINRIYRAHDKKGLGTICRNLLQKEA